MVVRENLSRSTVFEILRPARLAPTTIPRSKSLKSPFFPILMLGLNFSKSSLPHALKSPSRWLRWLWTSENTVDQHQQMTWQPKSSLTVETSHWTSSNMDSLPLHSSSRLWVLDLKMKCKSGLVAPFLKMSERGDSWCTDSSFSSLLVKLYQVFESALLDSFLKLAVFPVAFAHFPTQFLPSSQLCI